jgi:ribosomal protein L16 Arg81 hydroxylase
VTEQKDDRQGFLDEEQTEQVITLLKQGSALDVNPSVRLAYSREGDTTRLFINGETISQTGNAWLLFTQSICLNRYVSEPDFSNSQVGLGIRELAALNCLYVAD